MAKAKTKLQEAAEVVLRRRNRELQRELKVATEQRRKAEREYARAQLELDAVEETFTAFFFSIDRLALEVKATNQAGRVARELARKALEEAGVRPPSTLGSSRKRAKKKKRKKKP